MSPPTPTPSEQPLSTSMQLAPLWGAALGLATIVVDTAIATAMGFELDAEAPGEVLLAGIIVSTYVALGGTVGWLLRVRAGLKESRRVAEERLNLLELQQRRLVEAEKLAALGQLAAGVAHEVRNPLGVIKSSAAFVLDDLTSGSEGERAARFIVEECDRLNGFVTGLLGFAKQREPRLQAVALRDLVEQARELARPELEDRRVALDVEEPDGSSPAAGDPDLLSRVVYGLVLNAAQASAPGGKIRVRLSAELKDVVLEVADDGPGISDDDQLRVFEPFFTTRKQGTGLGLAIAQRIAEAHHGELRVVVGAGAGAGGAGACFRLALPRHDPTTSEGPSVAAAAGVQS